MSRAPGVRRGRIGTHAGGFLDGIRDTMLKSVDPDADDVTVVKREVVADIPYPDQVPDATWWRYVELLTGDASQKDIAAATGFDQSSISRWQRGTITPRAEAVVALARAYGSSPVEALVAAGYLSSSESGVVELTAPTGDLSRVSIDSLLSEIRRRVLAVSLHDAQRWPPGWSADDPGLGRHRNGEQSDDLSG